MSAALWYVHYSGTVAHARRLTPPYPATFACCTGHSHMIARSIIALISFIVYLLVLLNLSADRAVAVYPGPAAEVHRSGRSLEGSHTVDDWYVIADRSTMDDHRRTDIYVSLLTQKLNLLTLTGQLLPASSPHPSQYYCHALGTLAYIHCGRPSMVITRLCYPSAGSERCLRKMQGAHGYQVLDYRNQSAAAQHLPDI